MNAHRLALVAVASAAAVVVIGVAVGGPHVAIPGVAGLAAVTAGVVTGFPVVVTGGVLALVVSYLVMALEVQDPGVGVEALAVAPLIWLSFEASIRSFEVRPDVSTTPAVTVDWAMWMAGIGVATVGSWVLVAVALDVGPTGGVALLGVALLLVVSVTAALAVITAGARRRSGPDAHDAGSPGRRPRSG